MNGQAKITSLDALESFRAHLVLFVGKTRRSLHEITGEIHRARTWLQSDRRLHWEGEIRRRRKILDNAEQEMMSARLSSLRDDLTLQKNALRKAKERLTEAEEKLRNVKRWIRDYDSAVTPFAKKLESFGQILDSDMPRANSFLVQIQKTLESYTETPSASAIPSQPTEKEEN